VEVHILQLDFTAHRTLRAQSLSRQTIDRRHLAFVDRLECPTRCLESQFLVTDVVERLAETHGGEHEGENGDHHVLECQITVFD
jgi:hypothetical protein